MLWSLCAKSRATAVAVCGGIATAQRLQSGSMQAEAAQAPRPPPQQPQQPQPEQLEYASTCVLPTTWQRCRLLRVLPYNHDTSVFEFEVPGGSGSLQLPTCACLLLKAPGCEHAWNGGGDAVRPYTPISPEGMQGKFQLLIKRYREWGTPPDARFQQGYAIRNSYRPAGAVSNHLFELVPGEGFAEFCHKKPNVKIQYPFKGVKRVTMVAVGVGIAPMVQVSGGARPPLFSVRLHMSRLRPLRATNERSP